jgi:hypothetical protein
LSKIQKEIKRTIFYNIDYPIYLQGGVKDEAVPRDAISDASIHAGREVIISEDISDYFPSIKSSLVLETWQYFFNFPEEVALVLSSLTTYDGFLPQGAPTSSYIANLIFWDIEPLIEFELREQGFIYTRYIDDITVSADNRVTKHEIEFIVSKIVGMLSKKDLKPNRDKHAIHTRAERRNVHNLNVNTGKPTMSKEERKNIRAAVFQCERKAKEDPYSTEFGEMFERVQGRVAYMKRLHPQKGKQYQDRLNAIKPK